MGASMAKLAMGGPHGATAVLAFLTILAVGTCLAADVDSSNTIVPEDAEMMFVQEEDTAIAAPAKAKPAAKPKAKAKAVKVVAKPAAKKAPAKPAAKAAAKPKSTNKIAAAKAKAKLAQKKAALAVRPQIHCIPTHLLPNLGTHSQFDEIGQKCTHITLFLLDDSLCPNTCTSSHVNALAWSLGLAHSTIKLDSDVHRANEPIAHRRLRSRRRRQP